MEGLGQKVVCASHTQLELSHAGSWTLVEQALQCAGPALREFSYNPQFDETLIS